MQGSSAAKPNVPASLGKMVLLAGGLTGAAIALKLLPVADGLREMPTAHLSGAVGLVVLGALACAVGVPRQVVAFVAGYGWGLWLGTALALAAQMVGCALNLFWARAVGRDFVRRRLPARLAKLDSTLARRPFAATLALRLLPIGNNLALNLLAGLSSISAVPFFAASAIGYLPQTIIFALLGRGSQVGRTIELAISLCLLVISSLLALLIFRTGILRETPQQD